MCHTLAIATFILSCAVLPANSVYAREIELVDPVVDFRNKILPLLADRCFQCHGPDEQTREGGFRLDIRDQAAVEADSGEFPVVSGNPNASELIRRITSDDMSEVMPPPESNKSLSADEIAILRQWIAGGAQYEELWSLAPPRRAKLPAVEQTSWPNRPIDFFVLSRLEQAGRKPSPQANRRTLIRRATFDLTGLPPSLAEVQSFVQDPSPTQQAFERVVDRLLQSPAYGEHMAAEWLQLARFADSNGYQNDFRRSMWPWRDWVIQAFNDNMPYDQFAIEQMAGDLLPSPTQSQLLATGFHRNNRTVTEAGSIDEEWRVENNVDRVETTATVFLGLTIGCARCHDHKYDAITQTEFYEFYAFFNSIDEQGVYSETRGNVPPVLKVPSDEDLLLLAELDAKIAHMEQEELAHRASVDSEILAQLQEALGRRTLPEASLCLLFNSRLQAKISRKSVTDELTIRYPAGNPQWDDGIAGKAVHFSGTEPSYLELTETVDPDRDSSFTFSVWIRPDSGEGAIISRMNDAANYRGWDTILLPDRRLKVHLIHHWDDNAIAVITKKKLSIGQWVHIAVSYDGTSEAQGVTIYINGQPAEIQIEKDSLTSTIVTDQPVRIGRRSSGLYFEGAMTAFRWYLQPLHSDYIEQVIATDLAELQGLDVDQWTKVRKSMLQEFFSEYGKREPQTAQPTMDNLKEQRRKLEDQIPTVMILKDREKPRPTYLLKRGVYNAPDESKELFPDVPALLLPLQKQGPRNRLTLAHWLTDPQHPLFSRVEVNRIWQRLFGRGIVSTSDNFGAQGDPPSHPELLDWLAVEFIESRWNLKALQKLIVLSATYQQSSNAKPTDYQHDPENRLLSRASRFRLSAEALRDNALTISDLLTTRIGGPSVKPYQPENMWQELAGGAGEGVYVQSHGDDRYRRSLYTNRKRTVPHPTMSTFDAPSFEICQSKRAVTNTPLQALALLNDVTYVEAARGLAQRMLSESTDSPAERVQYGFRLATGREPTDKELDVLLHSLDQHQSVYRSDLTAAKKLIRHGEAVCDDFQQPELAAYTIVAGIILNLDETITRQ